MGKIRIKTLGNEETEEEIQKKAKIKKEQKQARKVAGGVVEEPQNVIPSPSIDTQGEGSSSEKIATSLTAPRNDDNTTVAPRNDKKKKEKFAKKKIRSKNYQTVAMLVDKKKTYPLSDAIALLEKLKRAKFDETVELHVNTIEAGITGSIQLPHGSGKKVRVAIADPSSQSSSGQAPMDELLKKVESGIIDFDILLATPQAMPKLAKVARILGPKGLMPNPKNGTVTPNPEEAAKKFKGGLSHYKTEAKTPIIHLTVGKLSFGEKKLTENINTLVSSLPAGKIKNITLKSTMSPGIKIQI